MTDPCFLTIAEASRLIRNRSLSPVDLVQAFLDRIAGFDAALNSYVHVMGESALAEARCAEAEVAADRWRGPLHGIPLGIKDIFDVAGVRTTAHSAVTADRPAASDATAIRLLREAGAIVLGKTATWEFAIGGVSTDLPWPPARNPWDLSRDPAGSSSGSGAAVAAGLCMGAMGTDTGGSIRSPAAWCGVAGLKPTYGLVSRRGIFPLSYTLDHAGPLCWTAQDCALMMQVLATHDPRDPGSAEAGAIDFTSRLDGGVAGLRVGVVRHFFEVDSAATPAVAAAFEDTLRLMRDAGAVVSDVSLAPLDLYYDAHGLIERSEAFAVHHRTLAECPERYGALARTRLGVGAFITASDYVNSLRLRARLVKQAAAVMERVDLLLMPTRSEAAQTLGSHTLEGGPRLYTRPFNLLGLPALSVCNGFTDGLPLSVQVVGRPFEDALVLRAGHFLDSRLGSRDRRPAPARALAA